MAPQSCRVCPHRHNQDVSLPAVRYEDFLSVENVVVTVTTCPRADSGCIGPTGGLG